MIKGSPQGCPFYIFIFIFRPTFTSSDRTFPLGTPHKAAIDSTVSNGPTAYSIVLSIHNRIPSRIESIPLSFLTFATVV